MPPLPKDPKLRQRKNRVSTAASLPAEGSLKLKVPPLPTGKTWAKMTREWWQDIWTSPMAVEYLKADIHGLYRLAALIDDFWHGPTVTIAAEIRQEQAMYGLTPLDRRRLQWQVEKVDEKKAARAPQKRNGADARAALRVVR